MILYEQLNNLLGTKRDFNNLDDLLDIFLQYCRLKDLLARPSRQNWYFKKGISTKKNQLVNLINQWEEIQENVNHLTVDDLIQAKNDLEFKITKMKASGSSRLIKSLVIKEHQRQLNQIYIAMEIKARFKSYNPLTTTSVNLKSSWKPLAVESDKLH